MKNFSKLFLASLLAGSLIMTGCGGENPTSSGTSNSDGKDTPKATDETAKSYNVIGQVIPTTGNFNESADVKITFTNIATQETITNKCTDQMFAFTNDKKIEAGYYQIKAEDNSGIYSTEKIYKKIDADIDDVSLTLTAKSSSSEEQTFVTLTGRLIDEIGSEIPFAKIIAKNTKSNQEYSVSTGFDNGYYTLNIPVGNYKVSYSKDSFDSLSDINLIITSPSNITFKEKKVVGTTLSDITMTYNMAKTGSIAGVLTGYTSGSKCTLFKTSAESAPTNPGAILSFTPKENGYFFVKNLQPGWYCVTKAGATFTPKTVGEGLEYVITNQDDQYFSWLEVVTETMTGVPSAEQ